ncbi:fatty acyl-AMP ligase [Bacillus sp. FJAT-27264]|uniref:fatty acyl-AMP ligase n=1 Tax=Paenibacillus sp. (strain DSM 101736 / FJAT-27264) TaxID=1850362 RepID=UPI000AD75F84|nr:fatty acyl-AMP ligase [Bacillus sp. FJAT-27264]
MSSIIQELSTVVELLNERSLLTPNRIAFTYREGDHESMLTYHDLAVRSKRVAASIALVSKPGDRVGLLHASGFEFVVSFFACLYSRTVVVPLEIPKPSENLFKMQSAVAMAGISVIVTSSPVLEHVTNLMDEEEGLSSLHWLSIDEMDDIPFVAMEANPHEAAFVQFTSGTTSTSKGVVLSHDNLLHNVRNVSRKHGLTENDSAVIWLPLYHNLGLIGGVLAPLYAGLPVHLISPQEVLRRPALWLEIISEKRATVSGGPNFAFDLCLAHVTSEELQRLDLSSWEIAFSGAEPVRSRTIEGFAQKFAAAGFRRNAFYPCYGLAESTLIVSGGTREDNPKLLHCDPAALEQNRVEEATVDLEEARTLVGCGQPVDEQDLVIVDAKTNNVLPENAIGEIWLRSRSVALGYLNDEQRTSETFDQILASGEGDYMRTGDTGFLRDGELYIVGRLKNLLIVRGKNFYANDLEAYVQSLHPAFHAGAAFSVEAEEEERIVILQEIEGELEGQARETILRSIKQGLVSQYGIAPHDIVLVASGTLPRTVSGKIKHYDCKARYLGGELEVLGGQQAIGGTTR